ncbi:MAG: macro domain-containing protein [Calditrichaceae bacterium]
MGIYRWLSKYKSILTDLMSGIGLFWLFVEIASYSTNGQIDKYTKSIAFFLVGFVLIIIIVLIKNRPRTSFSYKLRDKDNFIEVKVGDAFDNNGALIIPFNNYLDVSLGGNVKKANSLQNKLIKQYYFDKEEHLVQDILKKTNLTAPFDIGTTVEIEQKGKSFFLLVNSHKKENNRVVSTVDDFLLSLSKVWDFIALESGRKSIVTIPIISTNHGRITDLNRMNAIKEIINSYVEASKFLNIADKLIISIFPDDINKGNIKLDEVDEYLKFQCNHYRKVHFSPKLEGKEVSPSVTKGINN